MPRVGGTQTASILSSGQCICQAIGMHLQCVGPQKSAPQRTFEKLLETLAAKAQVSRRWDWALGVQPSALNTSI
jgi:hypothetical protein